MKKMIFFFAVLIGLQGNAMARVFDFDDLLEKPTLQGKFDSDGDHIVFKHAADENYPLIYKMTDQGVKFQLDYGMTANPQYKMLGIVNIKPCAGGNTLITQTPNVRGTTVNFDCQ